MENKNKEKYDREKHCGFGEPNWGDLKNYKGGNNGKPKRKCRNNI